VWVHFIGEPRDDFTVQTESEMLSLTSGPKSTFLVIYRSPDERTWAELRDMRWAPASDLIPLPNWGFKWAITADRTKLAYLDSNTKFRAIRVIDLVTGENVLIDLSQQIIAAGGGEESYFSSLAFAPDGSEVALGLSWKGRGRGPGLIWRVNLEGEVTARLLPPTAEELKDGPFVSRLQYSPDGRRLVADIRCLPSRLSLIEVDSGRVQNLPYGGQGYTDLAFSPDGNRLLAAKSDGLYVWRLGK